jgi:hypothetical protein
MTIRTMSGFYSSGLTSPIKTAFAVIAPIKMLKAICIIMGMTAFNSVQANHGSPKNCFACAELGLSDGKDVRMCQWDGQFLNPKTSYCCRKGVFSEYCVDEVWNKCSPYISERADQFYNYCPGITAE